MWFWQRNGIRQFRGFVEEKILCLLIRSANCCVI
jgi:hypothetical protein